MVLKKTHNYSMDFEGSCHFGAAALMGSAFFLRAVYFFGFTRPEEAGVWNLILFLILPMLLEAGVMVLLRGIRYNAPAVYGIMSAVYCLLLILQSFQSGGAVRIVLSVIGYLICSVALLAVTFGLLSKGVAVTALFVVLAVRFFAFDLSGYILSFRLIGFILEAAALCGIGSMICLSIGLREKPRKK